ncbi:MAG TPA: MFS transporter [Usitatibacteraceae bacterium]|nr:MFS transporter [Usitatibacteraceae bacterium]
MKFPPALRALNHRDFRRYYIGQAVSQTGSWMQSVAVVWLAYRLSGSPATTGLIGFLAMIPNLLITPFAGALSDRVSRRSLLLVAQWVLFVHALLLTAMTLSGAISIAWLALFAVVGGIFNAIEITTRHSFFAELIEERADLPNAIALNSANINATRLIGPAIGGVLIALAGEASCFGLNALSYLAVIFQLRRISPRASAPTGPRLSFLAELVAGWKFALGDPVIRPLVLMVGAVSFFINPYAVLTPAIAVQSFGQGAELHGLLISAVGIGALANAVLLARKESVSGLPSWILLTSAMAALGAAGFALLVPLQSVALSLLAMTGLGFGVMGTSAAVNTIIQSVAQDHMRGRVVSVYSTFFTGAVPMGHLAAGWTAERIGAPRTFLLCGCAAAIAALVYLLSLPGLRRRLAREWQSRGMMPHPPSSS